MAIFLTNLYTFPRYVRFSVIFLKVANKRNISAFAENRFFTVQ